MGDCGSTRPMQGRDTDAERGRGEDRKCRGAPAAAPCLVARPCRRPRGRRARGRAGGGRWGRRRGRRRRPWGGGSPQPRLRPAGESRRESARVAERWPRVAERWPRGGREWPRGGREWPRVARPGPRLVRTECGQSVQSADRVRSECGREARGQGLAAPDAIVHRVRKREARGRGHGSAALHTGGSGGRATNAGGGGAST